MDSKLPYCDLFGFDAVSIKTRLDLIGLNKEDSPTVEMFHERVMGPYQQQIVNAFYQAMESKPQFLRILQQGNFDLAALKRTQTHYMDTLGVDFSSLEYFENRLKIGWIHAQVGVPLSLYQSAYAILQEILIRKVAEAEQKKSLCMQMVSFILKISNLDMSLAITAYHHTRVDDLEDSINNMRLERVQLMHQATTDSLTSLPTRESVKKQLNRDLFDMYDHQGSVYLIMADLDHFKHVNDRYGHQVGDAVLKGAAARMRQSLRDSDVVGRYGGEEFIILLKNKTRKQAAQIAERIRSHVGSSPIMAQDVEVKITLSQGLAKGYPEDSAEGLIERADQALYEAKRNGRNCVVVAADVDRG